MALSVWKEWKNGQKKKVNESMPLVLLAQQTSGTQCMPREPVRSVTLLQSNSQPEKHTHDKTLTYMEKPTSVYKPHKNIYAYNPTMTHRFISTEHGYKFRGNQYATEKISHKWNNPDMKNISEEDKKKEGTIRPITLLQSNSQPVKDAQDKKPAYMEKPTSVYKPHKNIHAYNPSTT